MSILNKKYIGTSSLEIYNKPGDLLFDTSLANSIRRALYSTSHCYALSEKVSDSQKELYNTYFNINYDIKETIYTVSYCSFLNIQVMSHRINRMPIYYTKENKSLYDSTLFFCLSDPDNVTKPFINTNSEPKIIKSNDITIYKCDKETTTLIKLTDAEKKSIIKFDVHLFTLKKGDSIYVLGTPEYGCGYSGSEFEPVSVSYNFGPDAKPGYKKRDKFDNPEFIHIKLSDTGKKDINLTLMDALSFLSNQVNKFITEYTLAITDESNIIKIDNLDYNIQDINIGADDDYLADHTIGNLIACHALMYTINLIEIYSKDNDDLLHELLSQTLISYIAPDESAITRMLKIKFQLPLHEGFNKYLSDTHKRKSFVFESRHGILYTISKNIMKYLSMI